MQYWMNQGTTMRFNDIEKDIECCRRYGFGAIELKYNLVRNYELAWVRDLLEKNNVRAGGVGALQLPILQGEEAECRMEAKLCALCRCAHSLGADYITAIPPRGVLSAAWGKIEENAVKILKRYADTADGYQIKIAVEVTGFADSYINTVGKGLQIISRAEKKNLGLVYDFYHALGMEDLGRSVLEAAPEDIFIVHINDGLKCGAGKYPDDNRLWPGDGDADTAGQIRMLRAAGYQGPFSVEVYQPQIWPFDIQECYRTARDKMKKIEQLI